MKATLTTEGGGAGGEHGKAAPATAVQGRGSTKKRGRLFWSVASPCFVDLPRTKSSPPFLCGWEEDEAGEAMLCSASREIGRAHV